MTATSPANRGGRWGALPIYGARAGRLIATVAVTFLGLLVVTFLIGRVVPVDPVLAVVSLAVVPFLFLFMVVWQKSAARAFIRVRQAIAIAGVLTWWSRRKRAGA